MSDDPVSFGLEDARRIDRSVIDYEHRVIGRRTLAKRQVFLDNPSALPDCGCTNSNGNCDCPGACWSVRWPAMVCQFGSGFLITHVNWPPTTFNLRASSDLIVGGPDIQTPDCLECDSQHRNGATVAVCMVQGGTGKTLRVSWQQDGVDTVPHIAVYKTCQIGCASPIIFVFDSAYEILGGGIAQPDSDMCWPDTVTVVPVDCSCYGYGYGYGGGNGGGGGGGGGGCTGTCSYTAIADGSSPTGYSWSSGSGSCSGGCSCVGSGFITAEFGNPHNGDTASWACQ